MIALSRNYYVPLQVFIALFAVCPAHAAFIDNSDGTVSDSVTGLMWDKCSWGQSNNTTCAGGAATTHTWAQALGVAVTANAASYKGYGDWRLPNVKELESLMKIDASSPAIDTTVFPNTLSGWYWTASTYAYAPVPANAWNVDFSDGGTNAGNKTGINYVRLVRSGQSFASFDRFADLAAPVYQSAALNAANTVATLTFDEAPLNNLADLAALKAAVTFAADGTTFSALAGGDAVAIFGSTVTVTFATPLTGSTNKIKIAANSLKDDHGNVLASAVTTGALAANDITAPAYQSAALNAGLTVATLTFDETLVNNLASIDPLLKANVTFAADGTTFSALVAGDAVALSGSTLTVTFASALSGTTNKLKIAANSLKDAAGNVLASAVTTAALDATDTTPSAFSFTAQTGAALSTATESNAITVTGINAAANISISGGQYAVSTNSGGTWGAYTAGAGTVNLNDQVKVKLTSSGSYSTATTATLTIGGVSAAFSVTTQAAPAASNDPGPYVPPVINALSGGETTLTGTTPVNAAPGSTLVIPSGASVSGVAITLTAPVGGATGKPVTIKIGSNTMTVTPTGANVVVTLKTMMLNGVPTLVLAVSSGAVTVSAQPGQPLLTVSNSGMVVTAGENGGTVAFADNGNPLLGVTLGSVVLPSNAFASINAFATIQDGKLYAGEVAVLDASGKVARVRLGSLAGSGSLGDPLKPATTAGLETTVVTPDLKGKVARISEQDDFTAALAAALGKDFTVQSQNADGVLSLGFPGGKLQALPYGDITIDTSRADGVTLTVFNRAEVAKSGVVTRFAPAVGDFAQFTASLARLDKAAVVAVLEDGMVHVRFKGATYPLQPAWTVTPDKDGQAGLSTDEQGMIVYRDSAGSRQMLYPVFADLPRLLDVFKVLDATASVIGNSDGTATAKFMGKTFTLKPDYRLTSAPTAQAGKDWWQDKDGKVYLRNGDGSVQGFMVR